MFPNFHIISLSRSLFHFWRCHFASQAPRLASLPLIEFVISSALHLPYNGVGNWLPLPPSLALLPSFCVDLWYYFARNRMEVRPACSSHPTISRHTTYPIWLQILNYHLSFSSSEGIKIFRFSLNCDSSRVCSPNPQWWRWRPESFYLSLGTEKCFHSILRPSPLPKWCCSFICYGEVKEFMCASFCGPHTRH